MTKIFYDTEFIERGHRHGIDLISIGMVRDDGRTYYAVSALQKPRDRAKFLLATRTVQ